MRRGACIALVLTSWNGVGAQPVTGESRARVMFVNDEWERYTRVLQIGGEAPLYPWSVRAFSLTEMGRVAPGDSGHPWSAMPSGTQWRRGRLLVTALPAQMSMAFNSEFPFGYNDGAVWAGRGLTAVGQAGVAASAGPLSVVLAPVIFRAQNRPFELRDNGQTGIYLNGAAFSAHSIDQPQRFGDRPYDRFDPGNSSAHLDLGPAALGFSSAPMHWGPARDHPLLFGNNAGGFAHFFAGSARPLDLKLLKVHGRMLWGKIRETQYARIHATQPTRFVTGLVGVIVPGAASGLEIGGGRFFHLPWAPGVARDNLTLTLSGLPLAHTDPRNSVPDNQIASLFLRWALPSAGFEMYGEFGREDHSADSRDFQLQPDHSSAYLIGFQRMLRQGERRSVIRGELLNSRVSGLVASREQAPWYTHLPMAQGHTNLGQVLGSIGAFGGGASTLAFDRYSASGRWTVAWSRLMRAEEIAFPSGITNRQRADVQHAVGMTGLRTLGRASVSYEATYIRELNRDLKRDASNLRLGTGVTYAW